MNAGIPSVDEVFEQAIRHAPGSDRSAYLDEACGTDVDLRQRVDRLLKASAEAGSFLESPVVPVGPTIDQATAERPGMQVGPYKLLQQIGEGGMGIVFMAEQTRPVQRKVALKVIKPGMDSKQVIARFEAERQALAMMDHVNIARVFDGGTTESGRPYFVMELVHGIPITKYCDDNHLTPRERLELFIPVCQAIQHAHQKGVIHRDIKPSNVLVTLYDGKPVAKVIDFGVAKATEQKLTERTMFTNFGMMVGTLEYMSPEQAEMSALGVDTRSDIYSLGVLLYELLTGSTPISRQQMKLAAYAEVLRMIKDEEPPRPSTRLSTSGAALATISAQRKTEPTKLTKLVRGELDWIVMKTLEKDRNRRYESPSALARDIERFLADDAVEACPPSMLYRMRKMYRRNRGKVIAASVIFLSLVGGIIGTTWGLFAADAARQDAVQRESDTNAVLAFIENRVFDVAGPEGNKGGLGYNVTLRKAVEAALPFVEKSFADKPLIEARLRLKLARMVVEGEDYKLAAEQFRASIALNGKYRPNHPDLLSAKHGLAVCLSHEGKAAEAKEMLEEVLAQRMATLGPTDRGTLRSMWALAACLAGLGEKDQTAKLQASKLEAEVLEKQRAAFGPNDEDTLLTQSGIAIGYLIEGAAYWDKDLHGQAQKPLEQAAKLFEETLRLQKEHLGTGHLNTLHTMSALADTYGFLGRHADAIRVSEEVFSIMKDRLGLDHRATQRTLFGVARSYVVAGRYEESRTKWEQCRELLHLKLGPDDPLTITAESHLSQTYFNLGRYAEGLNLSEKLYKQSRAALGTRHPESIQCLRWLSYSLADCPDSSFRDPKRAMGLAGEYTELAPDNPDSWLYLGIAQYRAGDWKAAVSNLEKAITVRTAGEGFNFIFLSMAQCQLGNPEQAKMRYDEAVKWFAEEDKRSGVVDKNGARLCKEAADLLKAKEAAAVRK